MQRFAQEIAARIAAHTGADAAGIKIERPRDERLGDLAFPCFQLAKERQQPPNAVAAELAGPLSGELDEITASAAGPYVNFRVGRARLARETLADVEREGERYGGSSAGAAKTVVVDFSSPNIAKPMHVGHVRSTIIGAALVRIFRRLGYRVVGVNHIGDWGAQFGGLVVALRRWRGEVDLERDPVMGLLALYQRSKEAVENDPQFRAESIAAYQELESGREGEVRAAWRWVTEVSLRAFDATYRRLGVQHDLVRGESFYEPLLEPTLARIQAAGVAEVSQGALIVDLKKVDQSLAETPCLLRQSNGTTLYATRDLAALFQRWEEFRFERCLYVVGAEQKLHFRQLKAVLKRMGADWEPRVEHVDFGLLLGKGRVKLASRRGEVLVLDELIDEVVAEARRIVEAKNPELAPAAKDRVAEQVGIGAIVFNDLKRERIRDVVFDKGEILSFEGDTGPYVQYTHARLASILAKSADDPARAAEPDLARLEDAGSILVRLARFPDAVALAAAKAEPSEISGYLLSLCREIAAWLTDHRVLGSEPPLGAARLALVRASRTVLASGLGLLGVAAPDEM
jgi:arginyl-tRNA synthetase